MKNNTIRRVIRREIKTSAEIEKLNPTISFVGFNVKVNNKIVANCDEVVHISPTLSVVNSYGIYYLLEYDIPLEHEKPKEVKPLEEVKPKEVNQVEEVKPLEEVKPSSKTLEVKLTTARKKKSKDK